MKNTALTITTAFMMMISLSSFAAEKNNPLKSAATTSVISNYLNSIAAGANEANKFLFTNDFKYENKANNSAANKKEYLKFLKNTKGLKYDCETDYQILSETQDACIAKTTMQFKNFTRVDYIKLVHTEDGWKVNEVTTTYP